MNIYCDVFICRIGYNRMTFSIQYQTDGSVTEGRGLLMLDLTRVLIETH